MKITESASVLMELTVYEQLRGKRTEKMGMKEFFKEP